MSDWKTIDYFGDPSLVEDPYGYFEDLRAEGPVVRLPHLGVVAVTGYDEASDVYRRTDEFSSCNSVVGPFASFRRAVVVKRLPKTRSGKILRQVIRKLIDGKPYTVPSTIDDPKIIDEIAETVVTEQVRPS